MQAGRRQGIQGKSSGGENTEPRIMNRPGAPELEKNLCCCKLKGYLKGSCFCAAVISIRTENIDMHAHFHFL